MHGQTLLAELVEHARKPGRARIRGIQTNTLFRIELDRETARTNGERALGRIYGEGLPSGLVLGSS